MKKKLNWIGLILLFVSYVYGTAYLMSIEDWYGSQWWYAPTAFIISFGCLILIAIWGFCNIEMD